MHCGHREGCCMRRQCSDHVRKNLSAKLLRLGIAALRSATRRMFAIFVPLCVLLALQVSDAPAQIVNSPRELAVILFNLLDLLANDPSLPLPIRQRHDALQAYYQSFGGELLWLGRTRTKAFLSRLKNAL